MRCTAVWCPLNQSGPKHRHREPTVPAPAAGHGVQVRDSSAAASRHALHVTAPVTRAPDEDTGTPMCRWARGNLTWSMDVTHWQTSPLVVGSMGEIGSRAESDVKFREMGFPSTLERDQRTFSVSCSSRGLPERAALSLERAREGLVLMETSWDGGGVQWGSMSGRPGSRCRLSPSSPRYTVTLIPQNLL